MARDASDCLLCHLTGLFGEQRDPEYDEWLLQKIEQVKGTAYSSAHFSTIRSVLNIGSIWSVKSEQERVTLWSALQQGRILFDSLLIEIDDINDVSLQNFLGWNQALQKPFHIIAALSVAPVKDASTNSPSDSYQRLKHLVENVFQIVTFAIDGITFQQADFLWHEQTDDTQIEPRNHYLLRHLRSALDRIAAQQFLLVHSAGNFSEVNRYFSDGNNEAQLAGSQEMASVLHTALQAGLTSLFTDITSQFRLNSLETAYFHAINHPHLDNEPHTIPKRKEKFNLACSAMLSCTGTSSLDLTTLLRYHLNKAGQTKKN
ncbi:MAG: hypothetical protein JEZ00_17100 [Anaerolineaceae bacterium]|nr:hypothetical protein [Anaerolineaceae bacterium]